MKSFSYVLTLVVVALLVGGAWSVAMAADEAAAAKPADTAKAVVVKITDKGFEPAKVELSMGQSIEWQNDTKAAVTITDDHSVSKMKGAARKPKEAEAFNSKAIEPGKTFTQKFTEPGSYKYFNTANEEMTGAVSVKDAEGKVKGDKDPGKADMK